ncbi:MAG TPA: chemotaxis protein CheW [Gemmatimonadaceae bacterium]|jgi:purine-binding chemotaxis protein CheW|nr:chemotaxis protein CheW [Gemmatimonadaceae bacterium]
MSSTNGHVQIVTFRLAGDLFAADIHGVERVLRRQETTPVPNVPDWITGVIEYQKRVVPVIDLRARFEMDLAEATNETRVLVFNADNQWIAGVVDAVLDVAAVDKTAVQPPPELFRGLAGEYLKGIVRRENKLVMLLDVTKLLTATERLALELVDA